MQREGYYLIPLVHGVEPVEWRIRAAMSFRDLAKVVGSCAKAAILSFLLSPTQWFDKEPRQPRAF